MDETKDECSNSGTNTCPCKGIKQKALMIECSNDDCKHKWWHATCAGFKAGRKTALNSIGTWWCPICVVSDLPSTSSKTNSDEQIKEIKVDFKNLQDSFTEKFNRLEQMMTKKVETQKEELNDKFRTYSNVLATNIEKIFENNKVISSISSNLMSVKANIETKFVNTANSDRLHGASLIFGKE